MWSSSRSAPRALISFATTPEEPARLLMLSSRSPGGEICFYPDSGKIGLFGPELRK
jgi:hypothetical protein